MKLNSYLKNINILYVEDEENIREPLTIILKKYVKNIYTAKNGKEGLEIFKQKHPDIVISDIRMPIMDGIEMSKQIKQINPEQFIIIITAFSDTEYLTKAIDIGIDAYLTKPLEVDKLFQKLNFISSIIKNKKEKEELLKLLEIVFNNQSEAIILVKDNNIILQNESFKKFFDKDILEKINIDKAYQQITINEKTYKVDIKKLNNYILISFIDITNYENAIFKDSLTKLYNRKILPKIIQQNINNTICMIMLDIDNFKSINDTYGHLIGDETLKTLSNILNNTLRKGDIITRWGGEEFMILLKDINDINTTKNIAEKIRQNVEKENFNKVGKVTISLGVCCDTLKNVSYFDEITNKTDKALYKAKKNGKNQVQICTKDIN